MDAGRLHNEGDNLPFDLKDIKFVAEITETKGHYLFTGPSGSVFLLAREQHPQNPNDIDSPEAPFVALYVQSNDCQVAPDGTFTLMTKWKTMLLAPIDLATDSIADAKEFAAKAMLAIDAAISATPLTFKRGSFNELRSIFQDFSSLIGETIYLHAAVSADAPPVMLLPNKPKGERHRRSAMLEWFHPVSSVPDFLQERRRLDQRRGNYITHVIPETLTGHDRIATAERLREWLTSRSAAMGWTAEQLANYLDALGI